MKRLTLTPDLIADIKAAVGTDVDVTDAFAVFENISLNTLPLPGKMGSLFEKATVSYLTLKQMADSINGGNHLPLIHGHNMDNIPVGRVFKAAVSASDSGEIELRTLFYIDPTEAKLAEKVDAGSLDEVSVQFLASQILCSECEFDYRDPETATSRNFWDRTCANGHKIGEDGVHVRLVGLAEFTELSLVTRGAASKPKIVGKSNSKLAAPLQALAAKGFEVDELFLTASTGVNEVNLEGVLAKLTSVTEEAATHKAQLSVVSTERDGLRTELEAAQARVVELEAAAASGSDVDVAALQAEVDEAKTLLTKIYTGLATAAGATDTAPPADVTALSEGIDGFQAKLTAILPVGGVSVGSGEDGGSKFNAAQVSAFKAR